MGNGFKQQNVFPEREKRIVLSRQFTELRWIACLLTVVFQKNIIKSKIMLDLNIGVHCRI